MKSRICLVALIVFALLGCTDTGNLNDAGLPDGPIQLNPGDSHTFPGATVTFGNPYFVTLISLLEQTPYRIGIDIQITNNTDAEIEYSTMYDWGSIVTSTGEQLTSTLFLYSDNADYFDGDGILPGATIKDSLTFEAYSGAPASFKLCASPPFADNIDFEFRFSVAGIGTKLPIN
jgi:hypothetical protein